MPPDPIVSATLAEAATVGWREVTLVAVAEQAGMSLGELLSEAPTKAHLLCRFIAHLDRASLAAVTAPDLSQPPRDRVFEVLMRRFDALNQHRDGARAIVRGLMRDPGGALAVSLRTNRSAAAMLGAAGLSADGPCGFLRVQGLKAIFLAALRAWVRDDTADMANTMAALDKALRQAERLLSLNPLRRPRDKAAEAAAD
jgi:hypothetical protein